MRKPALCHMRTTNADQPAHPSSLTSAFVVRCPGSIISLVSVFAISLFMAGSVAEQASLRHLVGKINI